MLELALVSVWDITVFTVILISICGVVGLYFYGKAKDNFVFFALMLASGFAAWYAAFIIGIVVGFFDV